MPEEQWRRLSDAIYDFATRAELDAVVAKYPGNETNLEEQKKLRNVGQPPTALDVWGALMAVTKDWIDSGSREFELFKILCNKITSRNLVARGIQTKPEVVHQPIPIASRFFLSPKWDRENKIENAGHCFELVEICRQRHIQFSETIPPSKTIQKNVSKQNRKSSGRKSHADKIRPVVLRFLEDGIFESNTHQAKKAARVLQELDINPENPPAGFSLATIKRIIREEWEKKYPKT